MCTTPKEIPNRLMRSLSCTIKKLPRRLGSHAQRRETCTEWAHLKVLYGDTGFAVVALSRSVGALAGDVSGELSLDNMFPATERTLYLYSWTLCQMGLVTRGGEEWGGGGGSLIPGHQTNFFG